MRAGPMRQRVQIQERTLRQDSFGDALETWATTATVWARVKELSGREAWESNRMNAELTHEVSIRFFPGLTPRHRLLWGTRVLHIDGAVNPDGRKVEHLLMCREEV